MTQVCSLSYSTADVNDMYNNSLLYGIYIIGTDKNRFRKWEECPKTKTFECKDFGKQSNIGHNIAIQM